MPLHDNLRSVSAVSEVPATPGELLVSHDVRLWRELLARHADVTCALERELQASHQLGMSEYEVLERLAELPERVSKVQQIAGAVHLSQSALSRVIGRLEAAGLVERLLCTEDRRVVKLRLTDSGQHRQREAQPTQRRVLAERLYAPLEKACGSLTEKPAD